MAQSILACNACLRRAIRLLPHQRIAPAALQTHPFLYSRRAFASVAASTETTTEESAVKEVAATTTAIKNGAPQSLDAEPVDDEVARTENGKKAQQKLERAVRKQLSYLEDPWKIQEYVTHTLSKGRFDEALLLTQKASKDHQVTVSWNHLIDHLLNKDMMKPAIKLFNDMKKRGQMPNVHTYTIIFRGCAKSKHPKLAVTEAVKHYNVLLRDPRIQPNSIHLNAVLNVCGKAGDLDSMFTIADSINDSMRSATAYTYTSIINALRFDVLKTTKDLEEEQKNANFEKAIRRAKMMWDEAIQKWREGRVVFDEELICAMGRILLLAPVRKDKQEVLDLLEQTMNIPNMAKKEPTADASEWGSMEDANMALAAKSRTAYVVPSNNTLALVLTTLSSARLTTVGIKYWNHMVRTYDIKPDLDNFMRLFGMLKMAKASAHAAAALDMVPDSMIDVRHYRMVMEACIRDNINKNSIKSAHRALASMMTRLKVPDPHAMRLCLRVALVSHYDFRVRAEQGDKAGAKRDYGLQIIATLDCLWPAYQKLYRHYFKEVQAKDDKEKGILYNNQREVIALARIMYSSYTKVSEQEMVDEASLEILRAIGPQINRQIFKFFENRDEIEPNIRSKRHPEKDMPDYDYRPSGEFEWDTEEPARRVSHRRDQRQRDRSSRQGASTARDRWN